MSTQIEIDCTLVEQFNKISHYIWFIPETIKLRIQPYIYTKLNYQDSLQAPSRNSSLTNNIFSRVSGESLFLLVSITRPAALNSLSTAVEVAGGDRYFLTTRRRASPAAPLALRLGSCPCQNLEAYGFQGFKAMITNGIAIESMSKERWPTSSTWYPVGQSRCRCPQASLQTTPVAPAASLPTAAAGNAT